jgi:ribulose-phosphate 3-epimerase
MCEYGREPVVICPSLLGYEAELKKYLSMLRDTPEHGRISDMLEAGIDTLHIDVMTDSFIRRVSGATPDKEAKERFPTELVKSMRDLYQKAVFDVHLMVDDPSKWVEALRRYLHPKTHGRLGTGDRITIHYEATDKDLLGTMKKIKQYGFHAGVAINPDTPTDYLFDSCLLNYADMVLVMTVVPGKGGQVFMDMTPKIRRLSYYCPGLKIQVDGGIDDFTFLKCREAGATDFVVGSYLTSSENPVEQLKTLKV